MRLSIRKYTPLLILFNSAFIFCRGSFATVYKAVSTTDERIKVAIKEINLRNLGKQQLVALNLEMNILSQLHHESIVEIYAVYSVQEKAFMVREAAISLFLQFNMLISLYFVF